MLYTFLPQYSHGTYTKKRAWLLLMHTLWSNAFNRVLKWEWSGHFIPSGISTDNTRRHYTSRNLHKRPSGIDSLSGGGYKIPSSRGWNVERNASWISQGGRGISFSLGWNWKFKYGFMLISFMTSFIAYTETIHSLESYILIDEHVFGHKSKWAVAVRKQVFIEI